MLFQLIFDTAPAATGLSGGETSGSAWIVLAAVFGVLALVGLGIAKALRSRGGSSDWEAINREKTTAAWREAEGLAKQGSAAGRKLAVIEADKLLDHALKSLGFPGETMAERLKAAAYSHPKLRDVWTAHKWRNQLVHEQHFALSERQTQEAMRSFEAALRALKVLL